MDSSPSNSKPSETPAVKPAEVHISLPNGTRIDAVGPMAEVMAARLMEPQVWYRTYWPYSWNGYLEWNAGQVYLWRASQ
jgi:hypothetical protein